VRDDFGPPLAGVTRNVAHEAKLRAWVAKSPADKAASRLGDVLVGIHGGLAKAAAPTDPFRGVKGGKGGGKGGKGRRVEVVGQDPSGNLSDGGDDSVELMVGNTTDGGPGLGWRDDTADSEELLLPDRLRQQIAADAADDRAEESEDKEAVRSAAAPRLRSRGDWGGLGEAVSALRTETARMLTPSAPPLRAPSLLPFCRNPASRSWARTS
jgi:hypothetical protein